MRIKVLGTGSAGNAYIVRTGPVSILLEAGLPIQRMRIRSGFRLSEMDACLVSHEHGDHAKAAGDIVKNGIDLYASPGTIAALGLKSHRVHEISPMNQVLLSDRSGKGAVTVRALPVEHDAAQPYAYAIINPQEKESLLFVTDTPAIPYNCRGITHLMVEANYTQEKMNPELALSRRIIRSHMSIDTLEKWLSEGDMKDTLRQIMLLHLSDDRSDEDMFVRRIRAVTNADVLVA